MYNPASFKITDLDVITDFIQRHPFAQLISISNDEPSVSHIPILLEGELNHSGLLTGHLSRANSHCKNLDRKRVLTIFNGPHAYISSAWYETTKSVPTWNYATVQVRGTCQVVSDQSRLAEIIERLVEYMEADNSPRWSIDQAGKQFFDQLLESVVGFEILIESVEAKFKLNQNHSIDRRRRVIDELTKRSDDGSRQIAELMRSQL